MTMVSPDDGRPSISRTTRYKKVTKPLLERKRRARINRCLDELKDLMVGAFEVEGDNISKLEKADILELTVRHLTKLHSPKDPVADAKRFQAGFGQCAAEACQFILSMPEIDQQIGQNLVKHLTTQIAEAPLHIQVPSRQTFSPPVSPGARSAWSSPDTRDPHKNENYSHASSPSESHSSYSRREPPHVPLRCETAFINSNPNIHDLSKPMTGLLMTVDEPIRHQYVNQPAYPPQDFDYSSDDAKKKHDAEVKNVIMKKIREQILGRKTKESDTCVTSTSYDRASNDYSHHYKSNLTEEATTSMDLRKKSKGESKHFSPRDATYSERNVQYDNGVINYSMNRHNIGPNIYSKIDHIETETVPDSFTARKRHADYRNIHPKKILIRPLMNDEGTNSHRAESRHLGNHNEIAYQNPLRQQRMSNIRHSDHSREYYNNNRFMNNEGPSNHNPIDNDQEENMWRPW